MMDILHDPEKHRFTLLQNGEMAYVAYRIENKTLIFAILSFQLLWKAKELLQHLLKRLMIMRVSRAIN